jgi:predicted enzyme related to lactoylglutathione lyase
MCPVCFVNVVLVAIGATSGGGFATFALTKFLKRVAVQSLDQTIKKLEQQGGKLCVPKMEIPKVGWLAYAEDPSGNVFGIIEPNTNTK